MTDRQAQWKETQSQRKLEQTSKAEEAGSGGGAREKIANIHNFLCFRFSNQAMFSFFIFFFFFF
jgi:hypothetical protein